MKAKVILGGLASFGVLAAAGVAQAAPQPPMNKFNSAYYRCDDNAAFNMAYDDRRPQTAQMTVSPNSAQYSLKRVASNDSVVFSDGAVKFTTDGKAAVSVEGAATPLQNCKLQN